MKARMSLEEKMLTQRLNMALHRPLQLSQVRAETELVNAALEMIQKIQARKSANVFAANWTIAKKTV
jgi:hypothetical protein